ncbi:MAG: hypothetical protein WCO98_15475 [bacterium]
MKNEQIFTHGDLDGMVSGILLLNAIGVDTPLKITNHRWLAKELSNVNTEMINAIYLADLPLADKQSEAVKRELQRLSSANCAANIYDHHFGWESFTSYFNTFYVETRRTTAAVLVWQFALKRAADSGRWLALLSEKDNSNNASIRQDFFTLLALMQSENYKHTEKVLREMAIGKDVSELRRNLADAYLAEQIPIENALIEQVEITLTSQGRKIGWVDTRKIKRVCNVSKQVIEKYGVDLVATIIPNAVLLGAEGIDRGVDLKPLHGLHIQNDVKIEVVGHKSPIRINPVNKSEIEKFYSVIPDFIARVL